MTSLGGGPPPPSQLRAVAQRVVEEWKVADDPEHTGDLADVAVAIAELSRLLEDGKE